MSQATTLPRHDDALTPSQALRRAWIGWFACLAVPFVIVLLAVRMQLTATPFGDRALAQRWFLAVMAYMIIALPAAFFWRSRLFKDYWRGAAVRPRSYLLGMAIVWLALSISGLLAAIACLVSGTTAPNILPAGVALMFFFILTPTGRAMDHRVGSEPDAEVYEEPR